jgi:tetratricopeptide (TPR) repeat protein
MAELRDFIVKHQLALDYFVMGDLSKAIEYQEESLTIARLVSNRKGESITLCNLGNISITQGRFRNGVDFLEQSLAIARETGDHETQATVLGNLGMATFAWEIMIVPNNSIYRP